VGDDVNIQGLMIEIRAEYYKKKSYTTWVHKKVQIATKALSINYVDENRRGKIRLTRSKQACRCPGVRARWRGRSSGSKY
jgi:hypothetical protein